MKSLPSLAGAEWLSRRRTQAVFAALAAAGHDARAVGGCVRNALMGLPVADVDIATTALPAETIAAAKVAHMGAVPTGIEHGTVTVVVGGAPYEVTTLRRDVVTDGRRAVVAFSRDWVEDASRRDFTMNALYCSADGAVFDPLDGYDDLVARRVRFIGDPVMRIREDYLRILRFFRFHAAYGMAGLDQAGALACVRLRAGLSQLSGERVGAELMKLLTAPRAIAAVEEMFDLGLLADILASAPRLARFSGFVSAQNAYAAPPDSALRLAALAVHVAEDAVRLAERLRLSGEQRSVLVEAAASGPRLRPETSEREARVVLHRLGPEGYRRRVLLDLVDARAKPDDAVWQQLWSLPERVPIPPFPLAGRDLVAIGVAPGPRVGLIMRTLENHWIESDFAHDAVILTGLARRLILAP